MRRVYPILALFASFVLLAAGCGGGEGADAPGAASPRTASEPAAPTNAASSVEDPRAPLVVFLGDSITAGYGLSESEAFPAILDGELERMQAATRLGMIAPAFLLDKAIAQMESTIADARIGGGLVSSLTGRTKDIPGDWENAASRIVTKEVVPKQRRNPGYLAAEQMEIVSGGRVLAPTADAIERLAQGGAGLRQRPGPQNALGRVKFLFPNAYRAYMHDTPARHLFERTQRDFSHGCIRLADAAALARWVLAGEGWDAARVDDMLAATRETFVPLRHPIPVVIAYATAVAHLDGTIAFYDDIYGHDAALERALDGGFRYLR